MNLVMPSGLEPEIPTLEGRGVRPATLASFGDACGSRTHNYRLRTGLPIHLLTHREGFRSAVSRELGPPRTRQESPPPATCVSPKLVQRLGVEPSRPARATGLQPARGPSPSNATFGAAGSSRTNLLSLFRRALNHLSYSGEMVDLLGIEPRHDCLQGSGRQPIRTSPCWCPSSGIEPYPAAV